MKYFGLGFSLLLMGAMAASASPSLAPSRVLCVAAQASWRTFKAPQGTFSIALPGTAKTDTDKDGVFSAAAQAGSPDRMMGVSCHLNKKHIVTLDEHTAKAMIEGMEAGGAAKVKGHSLTKIQGCAAMRVMVEMPNNELADMLFVFTHKYMFQVMALHPKKGKDFSAAEKKRFIDSFQIGANGR